MPVLMINIKTAIDEAFLYISCLAIETSLLDKYLKGKIIT